MENETGGWDTRFPNGQGPRSQADEQREVWERMHYAGWPSWAVQLDKKLDRVLRMLDGK
jgi:hypothetical protein